MKKLSLLLLILVSLPFAFGNQRVWYQRTDQRATKVLQGPEFAELLADVKLDTMDTVYSRVLDLVHIPINYHDTGTGDAALTPDYGMGNGLLSCFDISDSAAVNDSVLVVGQLYKSQYAGDNQMLDGVGLGDQNGKSDVWATLGSAYTLTDVSNTQTIVEGTAAVTLASELDRFVRLRLINNTVAIKNRPRCRFYWVHKNFRR